MVGGDLNREINFWKEKGIPMPEKFILSSMKQILEGLKFAHARGVLHSDLKPANIFVKEDGTVLVADFGCAIILDSSNETERKSVHGTHGYVSPEQYLF